MAPGCFGLIAWARPDSFGHADAAALELGDEAAGGDLNLDAGDAGRGQVAGHQRGDDRRAPAGAAFHRGKTGLGGGARAAV
jgi:hypothetical protein